MVVATSRPIQLGLAFSALGILAGCQAGNVSVSAGNDAADELDPSSSGEVAEGTPEEAGPLAATGPFDDGSYEVTGAYQSPNGAETIVVSLTLSDGIVAAATVTPQATNDTSSRYQGMFVGGFADEVVGKPLADIEVTRIAGSSLTGRGFNDALDQIRAEAQGTGSTSSGGSY